MQTPKHIFNLKNSLFFVVFVLFFIMEYYFVLEQDKDNLLIPRLSIVGIVLVYYLQSNKEQINGYFLAYILCLLPKNILFTIDEQSVIAMGFLIICRGLLIALFIQNYKYDKRSLYTIFGVFFVLAALLLLINYQENEFFYSSVVITFMLVILLSLSFSRVLSSGNRNGNIEGFLAMCSFLVADAVFGSKKIEGVMPFYLMFGALFYYIAYILLVLWVLKNNDLLNEKSE